MTIVGSCHWLTNCHKELHLRCYNSSRSTYYSWLFYITYISFYNACILTRLNLKTKYVGFYIKYIHNKKAVKNATVGNITLHMYFMYKACKNFIPLPIWTQRCHYIETSPLKKFDYKYFNKYNLPCKCKQCCVHIFNCKKFIQNSLKNKIQVIFFSFACSVFIVK